MKTVAKRFSKPRNALVCTVALLGFAASGCGSSAVSSTNHDSASTGHVKLGFINPLSGPYASLGTDQKNALDLYLSQHDNKLGGRTVDLFTVDEGSGPQTSVPSARKLVQQDHVDVATGVISSATAAAVLPQFAAAKTPIVFTQGYPYKAPNPTPSPYAWTVGVTNPPFATSIAKYMAAHVDKSKGVYFLAADYSVGHQLVELTMKAYQATGGRIAGSAFPAYGTTLDYQPYMAKVKQSGAAAVYSFFAGSDAVRFVQQYAQFGLAGTVQSYSTSSLTSGGALKAEGSAALGIVTNGIYEPNLDNEANRQFVKAYRAAYKVDPDVFALQQNDALTVLDKALGGVHGALTEGGIVAALKSVGSIDTPRGTWTLDSTLQAPVQDMYLFEVKKISGVISNALLQSLGTLDPITGQPK
jgi:branched-chain amino acid transport system substrate-binding protein